MPAREARPQWRIELDRLWKRHKGSIALSFALLVAGVALCLGLEPETRAYCDAVIPHTNAARHTVANWTLSRTTTGRDLANEHCKGGDAHALAFHPASYFVLAAHRSGACATLHPRCGNKDDADYVGCACPAAAKQPEGARCCCTRGGGGGGGSESAAPALACADPLGCFALTCQQPRLSRKAFLTIAVTCASLIAMMRDVAPDLSMLAATLVLLLWPWGKANGGGNILTGPEAWQGFSNEAVLSVGALFIVAKGVDETGTVDRMFRRLLGRTKNLVWAQLRLLLPVAVMSAS